MLLQVIALTLFLTTCGQAMSPPMRGGNIRGRIISHADGSVVLSAVISGGYPQAKTFTWTLPDGTTLTPGQRHGSKQAVQLSNSRHELRLKDGYTTSKQVYKFKAENMWQATFTFTLYAKTGTEKPVERYTRLPILRGETEFNSDGTVTLQVTVSGGEPAPNSFKWMLPTGGYITPGGSSGSFRSFYPRYNYDGSRVYKLRLGGGRLSYAQKVTFNCEHLGRWQRRITFSIPAKTQTNVKGYVKMDGRFDYFTGMMFIEAEIIGGSPPATNFLWTVELPNGSKAQYRPGTGPATAVKKNYRGNPSTTIRVDPSTRFSRVVKLDVSSPSGLNWWWASGSLTITPRRRVN